MALNDNDEEYRRYARYRLTLPCGCRVDVTHHAAGARPSTRTIGARGTWCRVHTHRVGARVFLWELLPPQSPGAAPEFH